MSRNRYTRSAVMLILALGLILPASLLAQDVPQEGRVVTVQGRGAIIAGDKAKARDDAINDAQRNAVERVMGTHVQSSTITENFMLIQDNIYTRTSGYISSYEVTNETEDPDMITVTVQATVKESQLVSDLEAIGVLMARMNYPRLLVLVDEQIFVDEGGEERVPTTVDNATTTTTFMEMLQPKGFRFVDPMTVAMNTQANVLQSALEGDVAQAVTIGRAHQAEVIVLGTTIAKRSTNVQQQLADMISMQVSIAIRIIRSDTGEIMATSQENDAGVGLSPIDGTARAIERAMNRLGPRLEEMILERWNQEVTGSRVIELHIVNQIGFMPLQQFRQLLPYYVRGVQEVTQKSFLEGLAILEVRSEGDAMGLATELSSKPWEEFTIEVTGVTANQVRIRVTPKGFR
ncbi:flagellar assembly protein T N-terminal domain-containing protein [Gemmatimonadota bacterium]